jgi:L-histidine Nalpha-methyltransferase
MLAPRVRTSAVDRFAQDVCYGLSQPQKTTPPEYLYDDVGSALFEAITHLSEYGLTDADTRVLTRSADEIVALAGEPRLVVELGSGSGKKTRAVLEAAQRRGTVRYCPIDVSESALDRCCAAMSDVARVEPVAADFLDGLDGGLAGSRRRAPALVLFLGSTIGNFDPAEAREFLGAVRARMGERDRLLLGADLVKSSEVLRLAYDDPAGVTAAFNKNLLARINRELGADFDLPAFAHEARVESSPARVEMHLRSLRAQTVRVPAARITCRFAEGETIRTEKSHKFTLDGLEELALEAGFEVQAQWVDRTWPFAESLFSPLPRDASRRA